MALSTVVQRSVRVVLELQIDISLPEFWVAFRQVTTTANALLSDSYSKGKKKKKTRIYTTTSGWEWMRRFSGRTKKAMPDLKTSRLRPMWNYLFIIYLPWLAVQHNSMLQVRSMPIQRQQRRRLDKMHPT
jgi:hypothetical protein